MAQIITPSPDLMHSTTNGTTYTNFPLRFERLNPPEPILANRRTPNVDTREIRARIEAAKMLPEFDVLVEMAKKYPPPQEWWDEDFSGLQ